MKNGKIRRVKSAALLVLLAGCSEGSLGRDGSAAGELVTTAGTEQVESYEDFRASLPWDAESGSWTVDRDVVIDSEARLYQYYLQTHGASEALIVNKNGSAVDIWSRADRLNLTYCISQSAFGANYQTVVSNTRLAASAWENVANVHFVHVVSEDTNCTNANNNVKFNIAPWTGDPCKTFFPSDTRANRQFLVNANLCGQNTRERIGWTIHELGHVLGFLHEHFVVPGTDCTETHASYSQVTDYDSLSVMHYPWCKGGTNDTGGTSFNYMFITQRDTDGAQTLYEAPTNVVDLWDGTIFARKQSDGRLYKKSGSSWTAVSAAATAFVVINSDLYRLAAGSASHYEGGTTWSNIPGNNLQQLFRCGTKLCATARDQSIYQLNGLTWTNIGGAGNRHAATFNGALYGLNSKETSEWFFTGTTSWTNVGNNGYADLFADDSNVYGLLQDRSAVQRYSTGTTWVTIGGSGRQWLGVGSNLYALAEDGSSVWQYTASSNTWTNVGGAAARLYGSNGVLFATGPGALDIWRRGTSWTSIGNP